MSKVSITFISKKTWLLRLIVLSLSVVVGRLYYLQIQLGETFTNQSKKNFTRYETLLSPRGNILDTHGAIIATNRPVTSIYWKGSGNRKITPEQEKTIETLSKLVAIDFFEKKKEIQDAERHSKKFELIIDASFEQLSKVAELFSSDSNIFIETTFKRHYPHTTLACHLLGYLGHLDNESDHPNIIGGKMGIEKIYEDSLRGKAGSLMRIINSMGNHIAEYEIEKTHEGFDIVTTIDLELQKIAEAVFPIDQPGIFILTDPYTGSLRAVLSRPSFDPNMFLAAIDKKEWNTLQQQKSFLNRICKATYPPGSIFKLVTFSAALETGVVDHYSTWYCGGYSVLNDRHYHCARKEGHGELTLKQAFAHSCNIPPFDMARRLDIDTIARYAHIFGLGEKTNTALQEDVGLIPTKEWKKRVKGERWWLGETLSACIGQSFLLVTPLQMARMVGAVETGYLTSMRITEDMPIIKEPLAIRAETRNFLQQAMHAVTTKGTARRLSYMYDFIIRAKTSTAQTSALNKKKMSAEYLEHGWLAANFSYKGQPAMTMIILTEKTGGTQLPITIAKEFLQGYRRIMEQRNISYSSQNTAQNQDQKETVAAETINVEEDIE